MQTIFYSQTHSLKNILFNTKNKLVYEAPKRKNDEKKTHANLDTLVTKIVAVIYIVINWQINKPDIVQEKRTVFYKGV